MNALGAELTTDSSRAGVVDDGLVAWPERIAEARRQWVQAQAEDFEQLDKRLFRVRASGLEYRRVHGSPLLAIGTPGADGISTFFVDGGGTLVFLRRADLPEETRTVTHGYVIAREVPPYASQGWNIR